MTQIKRVDRRGWEAAKISDVHLCVEMTDFCNQRCIMCKQSYSKTMHGGHPKQFLNYELFRKIVADLKSARMSIASINPLWAGESMAHPQFIDMMSELFSENKKYRFFRGMVLNTNASLMGSEISDLFLDYARFAQEIPGFFFRIVLSLEAVRPETYAKIRNVSADVLEAVVSNISYLIQKRNGMNLILPNLIFAFIVMQENYREAQEFSEYWQGFLKKHSNYPFDVVATWPLFVDRDAIYLRQLVCGKPEDAIRLHRDTALSLGILKQEQLIKQENNIVGIPETKKIAGRPCGALWRTPNISACGIVTPCCRDMDFSLKIGDIHDQTLSEIWRGKKITELRLAHIKDNLSVYPQCLSCVEPEGGVLSEEEIQGYLNELDSHNKPPDSKLQNICLISREYPPDTAWGGIGTYTYNLANGLANFGYGVHVVCQSLDSDREYIENTVCVHRISHKSFFPFKGKFREFGLRWEYSKSVYQKVKEIIDKYRINVIEAPNFSGEGFIYSLHKVVPLVTRLHTHFSEVINLLGWKKDLDRRLSCWFENTAIQHSDLVTCSTRAHAELLANEIGIKAGKIKIIPLGVKLPDISPWKSAKISNEKTILFVGRLEKRKGIDVLIQAIPYVLKKIPEANFIIIGRDSFVNEGEVAFSGKKDSSYKEKLMKLLPDEYKNKVQFLGYVASEDLDRYYRQCDIFVAPSLYESFGFIYIEAMSYAKAVVGCGVGGVPEVIKDGVNGVLAPPADPQALADALIALLKDPIYRQKLGNSARDYVENNFSQDIMVKNTIKAYTELITCST